MTLVRNDFFEATGRSSFRVSDKLKAAVKLEWVLLRAGVLLLIAAQNAMPQSASIEQLISELPRCSVLRGELERGARGNGVDQPYMEKMRRQGVRRASLELHAALRTSRTEDIQVVKRLYFSDFDAPSSQISDEGVLKAIEASGLQADLDAIARSRFSAAPLRLRTVDNFTVNASPVRHVFSNVEFLANAWLKEQYFSRYPSGWSGKPLTGAVLREDASETKALLRSHRFRKKELDRALFDAAMRRYDNAAVIKLLVDGGADVNARTSEGTTPLFSAISDPCNLRALLEAGADVNALDKWGETVLQYARHQKQTIAIGILEEASAKP